MSTYPTRRKVLRGLMNGAAVGVGLPLLDCFLNGNGTALASGEALPVCFGTWIAGLGFDSGHWEPKKIGAGYENNDQFKMLDPYRAKINIFSGMKVFLDGKPMSPHSTGYQISTMGNITTPVDQYPSIDAIVADALGTHSRFRSLEVSCDGTAASWSRTKGAANPSEGSPVKLYTRIFGPEFKDPNAADFVPDPKVMVKRSALSAISEERGDLVKRLGATDRARLDEYFTSLRQLEQQLDIVLQRPAPLEACTVPAKLQDEEKKGTLIADALERGKLFSGLLAHALACGQTRVININFPPGNLKRPGDAQAYHMFTHEEGVDPATGLQPNVQDFQAKALSGFAGLLAALDGIKEGAGTLLDRSLVYYVNDHGYARLHTLNNLPTMTAGGAAGRVKTGIHFAAVGEPITRVGLTIQQALGVHTSAWGSGSNNTGKTITEVLA